MSEKKRIFYIFLCLTDIMEDAKSAVPVISKCGQASGKDDRQPLPKLNIVNTRLHDLETAGSTVAGFAIFYFIYLTLIKTLQSPLSTYRSI